MPRFVFIVVDMQNDFFGGRSRLANQRGSLISSINTLAQEFHRHNLPVIWVRQEFAADLSDAPRRVKRDGTRVTLAGTDGCQILPELDRASGDQIIVKKRYSAFFGTDLDSILAEVRLDTLVIAGINTHACVRMTAIDAYQRDYDVIIASDCIASYDHQHHEVTTSYLSRGIARFMTNAEITKRLTE